MQNINNNKNKLYKFAYLFTLNKDDMLKFANTFLKQEFTEILIKVIK